MLDFYKEYKFFVLAIVLLISSFSLTYSKIYQKDIPQKFYILDTLYLENPMVVTIFEKHDEKYKNARGTLLFSENNLCFIENSNNFQQMILNDSIYIFLDHDDFSILLTGIHNQKVRNIFKKFKFLGKSGLEKLGRNDNLIYYRFNHKVKSFMLVLFDIDYYNNFDPYYYLRINSQYGFAKFLVPLYE